MSTDRLDTIARLMEAESLCPMQWPNTILPRWRQVAARIKARVADELTESDVRIHTVIDAACEAYLGD